MDNLRKEEAGGEIRFLNENSMGYHRYVNGDKEALESMVMVKIVEV